MPLRNDLPRSRLSWGSPSLSNPLLTRGRRPPTLSNPVLVTVWGLPGRLSHTTLWLSLSLAVCYLWFLLFLFLCPAWLNHRPSPFPLSLLPGLSHTTYVAPGVSVWQLTKRSTYVACECPTVHITYVALAASNTSQYLCGSRGRRPTVHSTYVALGAGVQQFTVLMWLSRPASNSSQYLCGSRGRRPTVHSTYVALGAGVQQFTVLMWLWECPGSS